METTTRTAPPTPSDSPQETFQRLRDYLREQTGKDAFSSVVMAVYDEPGHPVENAPTLVEACGVADREGQVPNTPQTKFCICSIGKMFTATAIMQLAQQGRLSVGDPLGRYVPRLPPEIAECVTLSQLLTHTGGLGNYAPVSVFADPPPDLEPVPVDPAPTTLAGQVDLIASQPLQSSPGMEFHYSNDGFMVLGMVVEKVSGESYADYIDKHIFQPAGMADSAIMVYRSAEVPGAAHGYRPVERKYADHGYDLQIASPAGGALSTAGDMIRFARCIKEHTLLEPEFTELMLTGKVLMHSQTHPEFSVHYAFGFETTTAGTFRIVGHSGGTFGYECQLDIYPDHGYTVAMLGNQNECVSAAIRYSRKLITGVSM